MRRYLLKTCSGSGEWNFSTFTAMTHQDAIVHSQDHQRYERVNEKAVRRYKLFWIEDPGEEASDGRLAHPVHLIAILWEWGEAKLLYMES